MLPCSARSLAAIQSHSISTRSSRLMPAIPFRIMLGVVAVRGVVVRDRVVRLCQAARYSVTAIHHIARRSPGGRSRFLGFARSFARSCCAARVSRSAWISAMRTCTLLIWLEYRQLSRVSP